MARFSSQTVERVKESADIVEVVAQHTDLRRAGARMTGLCPFHDERTPSFSVDPVAKLYHCFGCGVGGDVISFVQEKEGLDFAEAVETLAERYGVEIERERDDPRAEEERRKRARLYELLQRTAEFYSKYLWEGQKSEAVRARGYLADRGLSSDALREFGVGMAPNRWDSVLLGGQQAGFKLEEMFAAGLLRRSRRGAYDYFRQRIMFPIRDQRGRVIGFGGRAQRTEEKAKYVNSPEGPLYRKGHTLYGIDLARAAIAKSRRAIVVEGYTDVIALHQAGIAEAVAIMGTAITPEQLGMLSKLGPESVVLALDADRAGADAMIRAQRVASGKSIDLLVAPMPEGEDPADMLATGEIERFRGIVTDAIDLPSFRVRTVLGRADTGSPTGRERALSEVAPVLKAMGEVVGRDELVREVADRLDVDPSLVTARVRTASLEAASAPAVAGGERRGPDPTGPGEGGGGEVQVKRVPLTTREARERALLAMCISDPKAGRRYVERLRPEHMSASGAPALEWLREHLEDPIAGLPRDDERLVSLITELKMRADRDPASEEAMALNFALLEQQRLEDNISAAQKAGDYEASARLLRERAELTDRIAHPESLGA